MPAVHKLFADTLRRVGVARLLADDKILPRNGAPGDIGVKNRILQYFKIRNQPDALRRIDKNGEPLIL